MFWRSDFVLVLYVSSYKKARVITQHCICGFWTRILEHFWSRLGKDRWCPAAFFASALLFWLLQAKYWRGRRLDQEVFKTGMVGEHLERRCFVCVRLCVCVWGGSISELFTIACIDTAAIHFSHQETNSRCRTGTCVKRPSLRYFVAVQSCSDTTDITSKIY